MNPNIIHKDKGVKTSSPVFKDKAIDLNRTLKNLSLEDLAKLMNLSEKLKNKTFEEIKKFNDQGQIRNPAIFTYSGTVFKELDPFSLNTEALNFAQNNLRILSGLYGILKPFDQIETYRLEMKTALKTKSYDNLYSFWKKPLQDYMQKEFNSRGPEEPIINLASKEYSKSLKKCSLKNKMITLSFKEKTSKGIRVVGMYAKMARGKMIRSILQERINDPDNIKKLNPIGYRFSEPHSGESDWVFLRDSK